MMIRADNKSKLYNLLKNRYKNLRLKEMNF